MIKVITAADKNFKDMVDVAYRSAKTLGYETTVYDLGGLGYGTPFQGKVSDSIGAKIPCKPAMILDALTKANDNDTIVWIDADAIMWSRIDEILDDVWDFGVTMRKPKSNERDDPINAGIVFVKKTPASIAFMNTWINNVSTGISDQKELNKLFALNNVDYLRKRKLHNMTVKIFPCTIYNNFYFKQPQKNAKIAHYKSKLRYMWPKRTVTKVPKSYSLEERLSVAEPRF